MVGPALPAIRDYFAIDDDIGKGLPLWLPNGTVVREELERVDMARAEYFVALRQIPTNEIEIVVYRIVR